jgi:hypothetical protein
MTMKKFSLISALVLAGSGLCHGFSEIQWGGAPFDTLQMYTSTGASLGDDFVFELGTFGGWTVDVNDYVGMLTNWKRISVANDTNNGWSSTSQYFTNSAQLIDSSGSGVLQGEPGLPLAGSPTFATNEQAYLWVHNATEWGIFTDNSVGAQPDDVWRLPNAASDYIVGWDVPAIDTILVGGANGVRGPGSFTYTPAGSYRLQTALFSPVPEPSGALLALLSLACLKRRRVKHFV